MQDLPTSSSEWEGPDDEPITVAFTTGGGCYPTWVGRTAKGDVACFLTDFFLLPDDWQQEPPTVARPPSTPAQAATVR